MTFTLMTIFLRFPHGEQTFINLFSGYQESFSGRMGKVMMKIYQPNDGMDIKVREGSSWKLLGSSQSIYLLAKSPERTSTQYQFLGSLARRLLMFTIPFLMITTIFAGCTTRDIHSDKRFEPNGQAASDDFSAYASPQNRLGDNDKAIGLAAAISGGGHRAANFGVGALVGLQNIEFHTGSNGLMEIDYFSTVSGGGFAAGSFISTYYDFLMKGETLEEKKVLSQQFSYEDLYNTPPPANLEGDSVEEKCRTRVAISDPVCVKRNINRGYHSPIWEAVVSPGIWFSNMDRGDLLERKIDCRLLASCWRKDSASLTLGDVFRPKGEQPLLPLWAANSTVYENGSIFPFTPTIAERYQISGYSHNVEKYCIAQKPNGGWKCDDRIVNDYFDIPMSVGVKASASFPTVVAATTLRSSHDEEKNKYLHLLDGGLSDNLGVITAIDMLNAEIEGTAPPTRKLLIVIDAFNSDSEPFSSKEGSPTVTQVLWHLKDIPLTSWRGRYRQVVESMIDNRTDIVHVNFDVIPKNAKLPEGCSMPVGEIVDVAKDVETSFNVTDDQQLALYCAGRLAIAAVEEKIRQLLDPSMAKYCSYVRDLRKEAGREPNSLCGPIN